MPAWVEALLQTLPAILAEIAALIKEIGGNQPTPAQAAKLATLQQAYSGMNAALLYHTSTQMAV